MPSRPRLSFFDRVSLNERSHLAGARTTTTGAPLAGLLLVALTAMAMASSASAEPASEDSGDTDFDFEVDDEEVAPIEFAPPVWEIDHGSIPDADLQEPVELPEVPATVVAPAEPVDDPPRTEGTVSAGLYFYDGVAPGVDFAARTAILGPRSAETHLGGPTVVRRPMLAVTDMRFAVVPGAGLDEVHVHLDPFARRLEHRTGQRVTLRRDIGFGRLSYERLLSHDRKNDFTVSVASLTTRRRLVARERVDVLVDMRLDAPGYRRIVYTDAHSFHGARVVQVGLDIIPEFGPFGSGLSAIRYIVGGDADIALGARDGGLFATHSDLRAYTGVGARFADLLLWDARLGYRGAVDTRRATRAGWIVTTSIGVEY